uniref:Uncharacterized protein n=1 Tax=Schistosoma japonicum TaxID=6182 RepID=C1LM11_SCHJA|nr:hypothetical protein [Schistosoma japonicum]
MFSNILFFIFFHSMVMYCNGVEDEEEYLEPEVKDEIMKYSYAFFKFLHSLYINLVQETLLNPSSGQEAVWSECKRLEYLHFTETAVDYMTEQKEVNETLLRLYKDRLDHASTMEKTTMFSVKEHNLFINRSEEKWSAQKRLNEVEKKYFAQTEQNENKNQRKVLQEFTQSYNDVYNQFFKVKNLLMKAVETANKYRKSSNRGRLFNKYRESGLELNDAFYDLANMIGEAEYRRFELCKTLPSEERFTTMLNLMDNGEITCKLLDKNWLVPPPEVVFSGLMKKSS